MQLHRNRNGGQTGVAWIALWLLLWSGATTAREMSADESLAAGRQLFESYCATCHGPNGDGNGPAAAQLVLKPRDFALAAFKFDTDADWEKGTDQDLAAVIRQGPGAFGGRSAMPAWSQFSDTEIDSLVRFIRSLEKR